VIVDDDAPGGNLPPVVGAGPDVAGTEGAPVALAGTVTDDGNVTVLWTADRPGCVFADAAAATTTVTCADDGAVTVQLRADDGVNPPVTDHATVAVANAAPAIESATWANGRLTTAFTDSGTGDVHRCLVDWGDGSPVSVVDPATSPCLADHVYPPATTATAVVTIDDGDGGVASREVTVVTDPEPDAGPQFLAPVTSPPKVNDRVVAGKPIPLKWDMGGDHGLDVLAAGYPLSTPRNCLTGEFTGTSTPTSHASRPPLTYDAESGVYQYSWKTERSWRGTCHEVVVRLTDGTERKAWFLFN
jgi:hypothetical protein